MNIDFARLLALTIPTLSASAAPLHFPLTAWQKPDSPLIFRVPGKDLASPLAKLDDASVLKLLGHSQSSQRDAASAEAWNRGDRLLPALANLKNSEDPEIAERASRLVALISSGIPPKASREEIEFLNELQQHFSAATRKPSEESSLEIPYALIRKGAQSSPAILLHFAMRKFPDSPTLGRVADIISSEIDRRSLPLFANGNISGVLALYEPFKDNFFFQPKIAFLLVAAGATPEQAGYTGATRDAIQLEIELLNNNLPEAWVLATRVLSRLRKQDPLNQHIRDRITTSLALVANDLPAYIKQTTKSGTAHFGEDQINFVTAWNSGNYAKVRSSTPLPALDKLGLGDRFSASFPLLLTNPDVALTCLLADRHAVLFNFLPDLIRRLPPGYVADKLGFPGLTAIQIKENFLATTKPDPKLATALFLLFDEAGDHEAATSVIAHTVKLFADEKISAEKIFSKFPELSLTPAFDFCLLSEIARQFPQNSAFKKKFQRDIDYSDRLLKATGQRPDLDGVGREFLEQLAHDTYKVPENRTIESIYSDLVELLAMSHESARIVHFFRQCEKNGANVPVEESQSAAAFFALGGYHAEALNLAERNPGEIEPSTLAKRAHTLSLCGKSRQAADLCRYLLCISHSSCQKQLLISQLPLSTSNIRQLNYPLLLQSIALNSGMFCLRPPLDCDFPKQFSRQIFHADMSLLMAGLETRNVLAQFYALPNSAACHIRRDLVNGNFKAAEERFKFLVNLSPGDTIHLTGFTFLLVNETLSRDVARPFLRMASNLVLPGLNSEIARFPNSPGALSSRAYILSTCESRLSEARADAIRAVQCALSQHSSNHLNSTLGLLAHIELQLGNTEKAREIFTYVYSRAFSDASVSKYAPSFIPMIKPELLFFR